MNIKMQLVFSIAVTLLMIQSCSAIDYTNYTYSDFKQHFTRNWSTEQ